MPTPTATLADPALAARIIDDAVAAYFEDRRRRLPDFLERTYSWRGASALNAKSIGHDLWRAPVNVALAGPNFALKAAGDVLRRLPGPLRALPPAPDLHLKTDAALELEWRLYTDLLELPFEQPETGRKSAYDALGARVLSDPRLDAIWHPVLAAQMDRAQDPALRRRLYETLTTYQSSRAAVGEVANLGLSLTIGALITHQMTPGALTLAPGIAQAAAEKIALAHFPLGAGLGKIWYQFAPASPGFVASAGVAAGVVGLVAALTAVSGFVTDPLQYHLGLHGRRLQRMIASLEETFSADSANRYFVRDHYLARLLDMLDLASAVWRHAR